MNFFFLNYLIIRIVLDAYLEISSLYSVTSVRQLCWGVKGRGAAPFFFRADVRRLLALDIFEVGDRGILGGGRGGGGGVETWVVGDQVVS